MFQKSRRSKGIGGYITGGGILVLIAMYYLGRFIVLSVATNSFADYMSGYVSSSGLKTVDTAPSIVGKVIAIDVSKNRVDEVHLGLPGNLRATSPEEVGTVVWIDCDKQSVGTYTDGAKAYRIKCQVTVIHKDEAIRFPSKSFSGSKPPEKKSVIGSKTGSRPTKDIVAYLEALP